MGKMALDNGIKTKGEVHWIISYDKDKDTHYVECPVTPMEFGEDGEVTSGKTWDLSVLTEGSFMECVEWIYSLARMESVIDGERQGDMEEDRTGGS